MSGTPTLESLANDAKQSDGDPSQPRFFHELFEQQVDRRGDEVALIFRDLHFSFREVDDRANQLARHLSDVGVGPGQLVGLYLERSEKSIIAILAILKAGGGYVPLDPSYPPDRIEHILADAQIDVVVTETKLARTAAEHSINVLLVIDCEETQADLDAYSTDRLTAEDTGLRPTDLSYIIYTSGTTGRPKGIMTEHHNVVAFTAAFHDVCRCTPDDRVYQGFSLGFDGSVEEMGMAFSSGAPLVVGPPEFARLGDDTAAYMREHGVSFFSTVPTFLSMIKQAVPSLRLIVVSGEACPPELVRVWVKPGLRMLNVYGPTETTVNTTVWDCRPDVPVTIGRPLPGYDTWILDEQMRPVADGEAGELYIGGVGVARGYLNQPELTAKHFVPNPFDTSGNQTRLYRTGDLVKPADNGELLFLGRIDSQVKVRGYRIELGEIEAVLRDCPGIDAAVLSVVDRDGLKHLAAYVTMKPDAAAPLDRNAVLEILRNRLPPYMVPGFLDVIERLPMLASGKVDRRSLPEPQSRLVGTARATVAPRNEIEEKVAGVWQQVFDLPSISVEDDFFLDLGGDSLLAALLVSLIRAEPEFEVSIREVYDNPTVAKMAAHLERQQAAAAKRTAAATGQQSETPGSAGPVRPRKSAREVFEETPRWKRYFCVFLQLVTILLTYGIVPIPLVVIALVYVGVTEGVLSLAAGIGIVVAGILLAFPVVLLLTIVAKWFIIGRYKAGSYPLWGFTYFRYWLTSRLHEFSGIHLLAGTPVMSLYFRLMGAKVGRGCIIDTPNCFAFDLVSIGDDTCIGSETQLLGVRVEDGLLHIGRVDIGSRCFVGIHANFGLNSGMGDDARLGDLSLVPDGQTIPDGASWCGSPGRPGSVPLPEIDEQVATRRRRPVLFGLLYFLATELIGLFLLLTMIPSFAIITAAYWYGGVVWGIASVFVAVPVGIVAYCVGMAVVKKVVLPKTRPGTYPVESWFFLRKWTMDSLMSLSRGYMLPLYTTIFLPTWLRMMGAKIGKGAEISTVFEISPDLVEIGVGSFFADGSMIGGRHLFRGHVQLGANRIGDHSFVGNSAILSIGKHLGADCLLGVMSTPPADHETAPDGTEWLGAPSFRLPHRKKVEGFDLKTTFKPTKWLYFQRLLIDGFRVVFPGIVVTFVLLAFLAFLAYGLENLALWQILVLMPFVDTGLFFSMALIVVVMKWVVMGRYKPVIKPLWCRYIWWNEAVNGAYESIASPVMFPLMGTPMYNVFLRLLGCKIGKGAYVDTSLFSEFDMVRVGDFAALNTGMVPQNHLFEDRVFKSSYLNIGEGCSVGNMSVVLYDSEMQPGSSVGPLSLLMKGETIPARSRWIGIPTGRVE